MTTTMVKIPNMLKFLFLIALQLLLVEVAIASRTSGDIDSFNNREQDNIRRGLQPLSSSCKDTEEKFFIKRGKKWVKTKCFSVGQKIQRCDYRIKNSDKLGKDMCPFTCNNCLPIATTSTPTVKPTTSTPTATPTAKSSESPTEEVEQREPVETCYDYTKAIELGRKDCKWHNLFNHIRDVYNEQDQLESTWMCVGGLARELRKLTGKDNWKVALMNLCPKALYDDALDEVETVTWKIIEDANIDLEEFYKGGGFMNNDYGNLQQKTSEFVKRGGYANYFYIGEDPTLNDYLPTPERSVEGGKAILNLYEEVTKKFLSPPSYSKLQQDDSCPLTKAVVCCWSRDRQYNDNNGSCSTSRRCRNGKPADNTDLCWTTDDENDTVFPYPGQENPLHCHGYSWSDGDLSDELKNNNLFYVSMYDHLYKRGYVQSITDDDNIEGNDAMCGCVEDMTSVVARADCTEIVPRVNYTVYQNENDGYLEVKPFPGTFEFEYRSCEGFNYDSDVSPEMYSENPKHDELGLKRKKNDLSALVYRQYLEGKKTLKEIEAFEEKIIGFKDPKVNLSDEEREAACKAAFDARYPDKEWKVVLPAQEEETVGMEL